MQLRALLSESLRRFSERPVIQAVFVLINVAFIVTVLMADLTATLDASDLRGQLVLEGHSVVVLEDADRSRQVDSRLCESLSALPEVVRSGSLLQGDAIAFSGSPSTEFRAAYASVGGLATLIGSPPVGASIVLGSDAFEELGRPSLLELDTGQEAIASAAGITTPRDPDLSRWVWIYRPPIGLADECRVEFGRLSSLPALGASVTALVSDVSSAGTLVARPLFENSDAYGRVLDVFESRASRWIWAPFVFVLVAIRFIWARFERSDNSLLWSLGASRGDIAAQAGVAAEIGRAHV